MFHHLSTAVKTCLLLNCVNALTHLWYNSVKCHKIMLQTVVCVQTLHLLQKCDMF